MKNIMIIDAYNMIHRCRFQWGGGLADGEFQVVYNFLRTLRSTIDQFKPDKVYFPLDGKPSARLEVYPEYKGTRRQPLTDPAEIAYWNSFKRQKREIIDFVTTNLPVTSLFHPNYECDDLVLHIVDNYHPEDYSIIISSDTDFIQILNKYPETVQLYNPVSSAYRQNTEYDYVSWKAMVGDKSDNIPGVKGIGKKTASKILGTKGELAKRLEDSKFSSEYNASYDLIKLYPVDEEGLELYEGTFNEDIVRNEFERMEFSSMLKDTYFDKFKETFTDLLKRGE
tara:strand:- start:418 stop:1263 length:846 start_codon:yes stop_codon:yes gene_type:complete